MDKIIKLSIIFLVLGSILISGCIDSEKPSEIGGPSKPVNDEVSNDDITEDEGSKEWIEIGPYDNIYNLMDVNGKLAFIAEKDDMTFIVSDGNEGTSYPLLFQDDLVNDEGKLAYSAINKEGEYVIVYENKEFGAEYESVRSPRIINDKLAYIATKNNKEFVVYNGIEGIHYDRVTHPTNVGGKLAYRAIIGNKGFIVYGDEIGKQYDDAYGILEVGGKLVYRVLDGNKESLIYDGKEIARFDRISYVSDISGKLAFRAIDGEDYFIVYDGQKIGPYDDSWGPYNIGGKLAYEAEKNGDRFSIYDGEKLDSIDLESLMNIGGKLSYLAYNDRGGTFLVYGDKKFEQYGIINRQIVDVDGKLVFYALNRTSEEEVIYYDGKEIETYNSMGPSVFLAVGKKLAYSAFNEDWMVSVIIEK